MLEHMLADRQSNVTTLRSLGHDLVSLDLDPAEQRDLQTAVDECVARYSAVSDVCVRHRTELDCIEAAVSSYRTKLDAFLSWLDATEHSAIMTDVISPDVDAVQQQTAQQQVCCCCCCCRHLSCSLSSLWNRAATIIAVLIFDLISMGGSAIASVRPSICPSVRLFPLYLRNRPTVDLELLHASRS